MNAPKRPSGITVVAIISLLYGGADLIAILGVNLVFVLSTKPVLSSDTVSLLGSLNLALGIGQIIAAMSLWQMRPTALTVARIVWSLQIAGTLLAVMTTHIAPIHLIAPAVCIYLFLVAKRSMFIPLANAPSPLDDETPSAFPS